MEVHQYNVVERSRRQTLRLDRPTAEIALFNAGGSPFTASDLESVPITVATAIGTAAKTTTAAEPEANTLVAIKFTNGNSAETPTVAFDGGDARAIKLGGTASAAAKFTLAADGVALFFFDGTVLNQVGAYT